MTMCCHSFRLGPGMLLLLGTLGCQTSMTSTTNPEAIQSPLATAIAPAALALPITASATSLSGTVTHQARPARGVRLRVNGPAGFSREIQSDGQGQFVLQSLNPGSYQVTFYNDTNRSYVGFWRSPSVRVDAGQQARLANIDLALTGFQNQPLPGTTIRGLTSFSWTLPRHPVAAIHWRLHSQGGTRFELLARSPDLRGDVTQWRWEVPQALRGRRCFWGLQWRTRDGGVGGNLFQPITLGS
jgi:hypothetical protein